MTEVTLPSDVTRQASLYYEGLGTPVALAAAVMLRSGCWDGLAALSVKPSSYNDSLSYFRDASAAALLKKLQQLPGSAADRRMRTIRKWWEGERACLLTNHRLSAYMPENLVFDLPRHAGISAIIAEIRKTILDWIGPQPPELALGRFGPGATFSDRGGKTTVPDKMSSDPTLTRDAVWYLPQWLGTAWGADLAQRGGELSFVEGNRFATVPKTALIDRSIASEPSINGFYQLALGRALRSKLRKRTGWDLDCAQTIHRRVAGISSVTRELATLDLSNASDTVSKELVRLLLPRRWFDELDHLRSKKTLIDRKWVVLEKFSSMGNGFTFELETLIFAALMSVLLIQNGRSGRLGVDVFVFGDDILIPDDLASQAEVVLRYCGFSLNREKSFSGSVGFRESCGGDFFEGADVRSYYIKELRDDPWQLLPDYNGMRRTLSKLQALTGVRDYSGLRGIFSVIPTVINRCRGPQDLGDIVLHTDDPSEWRIKWKEGIRYFRCVVRVSRFTPWHHWKPDVVLASALYGVGDGRLGVLPRDPPFSFKVKWVPLS